MNTAPPIDAPDWNTWLDAGETLIWTGRPAPGWRYSRQDLIVSVLGVVLLCVTLLLMTAIIDSALRSKTTMALPVQSLLLALFLTVSGLFLFGAWWMILGHARARERLLGLTFYALTRSQSGTSPAGRALIRVTGAWPKFSSWPITARLILDIREDRKSGTTEIDLGDYIQFGSEGDRMLTRTGFVRLADGPQVFALLRQLQMAGEQCASQETQPGNMPGNDRSQTHIPAPDQT